MSPRALTALFALLALAGSAARSATPAGAASGSTTPSVLSESGNPIADQGSSYNYRSNITYVTPQVPGLSLQVLEFADRLVLTNRTGKTVTVYGYQGEPYARVRADGTVEVNTRSPAYYLNQNFYANVTVPPTAYASAPAHWVVVDRTGQFEWHDHRIHWMSPTVPPQVKDRGKRTLIFDWQVPIAVGATMGSIDGQLFWTPENSKAPTAVIVIGAVIVVAGLLFVVLVRRRRTGGAARGGGEDGRDEGDGSPRAYREAW